jgi:hypothetical protein
LLCEPCSNKTENLVCKPTHTRGRSKDLVG